MKAMKLLLGVLVCTAAGTLLGVLFAPEKGAKMRKRILNKGDDYADVIKERLDDLLEDISEKYDDTKKKAENIASNGKTKYENAKKEAKSIVS